jgi:hypothetical protein
MKFLSAREVNLEGREGGGVAPQRGFKCPGELLGAQKVGHGWLQ